MQTHATPDKKESENRMVTQMTTKDNSQAYSMTPPPIQFHANKDAKVSQLFPTNDGRDKNRFQFPAQLKASSSTSEKSPVQRKSSSNGLPAKVQAKMENSMGHDFSNVNIHQNSQSATDVGALAYAQGNNVHFAPGQFKPDTRGGQELIGHELAHVVQQREGRVKPTKVLGKGMAVNDDPRLEKEADVMGRKAARSETFQAKKTKVFSSQPVFQGYFVQNDSDAVWQQAEDLSVAVKEQGQNHELYAEAGKVATANAKLSAVDSGIELVEKSETKIFRRESEVAKLKKVETKNTTNTTEGDNMEIFADCGKSNAVVVGGSNRQAVYSNSLGIESHADGNPATMKIAIMKEWLDDKYPTATETEKAEIDNIRIDSAVIEDEMTMVLNNYHNATTDVERDFFKTEYFYTEDALASVIWRFYNNLNAEGKDVIDEGLEINTYAKPEVGQGYTMSTGGNPILGDQGTWNYHWGGVIMESNDKKDKIVLENYAITDQPNVQNTIWDIEMYGTENKSQTFHEKHKASDQHGESPTTMTIESK